MITVRSSYKPAAKELLSQLLPKRRSTTSDQLGAVNNADSRLPADLQSSVRCPDDCWIQAQKFHRADDRLLNAEPWAPAK